MTMDTFRLEGGKWVLMGSFTENDKVRAEPFQEIEINLEELWLGNLQKNLLGLAVVTDSLGSRRGRGGFCHQLL